ncbi:MAG: hypothetical protein ACE5FS_12690 [Paracoccaceae bacterium]
MFKRIATASLIFGMAAAAPPAAAQVSCAQREKIVLKLEKTYGESRTGSGLNGNSSMIEIWASAKTGTWTILMTRPDGISCVMATGQAWEDVPLAAASADAPA